MNRKIIKYILATIVLCLLPLAVYGLADKYKIKNLFEGVDTETAFKESKVILNYYTWEKTELTSPIFEEYSKEHPNIKVKVNYIPDDANSMSAKLDTIALGGGEMDIWPMNNQFLRMKKGMLRNINDYIEKDDIDMKEYFGAAEASAKFDGNYYGLPYQAIIPMIFFNKDMFDAAGLPYPSNDWTYEDLYNTAKKLTKGKGNSKVYGFMQNWFSIFGGRPGSTSLSFYGNDGLSNFRDNQYWEEALVLRKKMDTEGIEIPYSEVKSKGTYSSIEFLNGRVAMTWGASWVVRDMKDKQNFPFNFRVGCVLPPRVDENTENLNQVAAYEPILGIPVTSKHPDEAWKFIKFYVEKGSESTASAGNVPVYRPAYSDKLAELFAGNSGLSIEEARLFFQDQLSYEFMPKGAAASEYGEIILEESGKYLTGNQTIQQTLNNIKKKADEAIQKEKADLSEIK